MNSAQTLKRLQRRLAATRMSRNREINAYVGERAMSAVTTGCAIDTRMVQQWRYAALETAIAVALKSQLERLDVACCALELRIERRAELGVG